MNNHIHYHVCIKNPSQLTIKLCISGGKGMHLDGREDKKKGKIALPFETSIRSICAGYQVGIRNYTINYIVPHKS